MQCNVTEQKIKLLRLKGYTRYHSKLYNKICLQCDNGLLFYHVKRRWSSLFSYVCLFASLIVCVCACVCVLTVYVCLCVCVCVYVFVRFCILTWNCSLHVLILWLSLYQFVTLYRISIKCPFVMSKLLTTVLLPIDFEKKCLRKYFFRPEFKRTNALK